MVSFQYGTKIPFEFRRAFDENPKALNHYIFDDLVLKLFKRSCGDATLEDVLKEEEMLCNFFGTAEHGKGVLKDIVAEEWDAMDA